MTNKLLFVTTLLLVVACVALAADVSGKWTYQQPGRNGGDPIAVTITLKADGAKLTGTVPGFARGGAPGTPTEITNGKVDGDKIYFEVKRAGRDGNEMITKYEGTMAGDELKLTVTRPAMGGGDPPPPAQYAAKREKS
jgi:hypothetical protein